MNDDYAAMCDVCHLTLDHRDELGGRCAVLAASAGESVALGALLLRERPLLKWRTDEAEFSALGADANLWFAYASAADRHGDGGAIDRDLEPDEIDRDRQCDGDADRGAVDGSRRRRVRALLSACACVRGERFERFVELAKRATQLRVLPRVSEDLKVRLLLISDTNAHATGADSAAIFALGCKVAHSCRANVAYRFVRGALQYRVIRPLRVGDALTFNYLGENVCRDTASRSDLLQLTKRFTCRCELCCEPDRLRALPCHARCGAAMLCDAAGAWRCMACAATWSSAELLDTALARERTAVALFEKQEWYSNVSQRLTAAARAERLVGALHWSVAMQHRKVLRNILQLEANRASEQRGLSATEVRDRYAAHSSRNDADAAAAAADDDDYAAYVAAMNCELDERSGERCASESDDFDDDERRLHIDGASDDGGDASAASDDDRNGESEPLSGEALLHKAADSGMQWATWAMHCDAKGALATTAATAMQELHPLLERLGRRAEADRIAAHFREFYADEWLADEEDDEDA